MEHGNRTALVTGGARGPGTEICRQLADRGLRVLVAARKREAAEEVCRGIGPAAVPLALDVSCASSVTEAVREALGRFGTIDVLVNAADPGWTRSGMGGPTAPRGPEEGADAPVWLATLPEGDETTGGLFADRTPLQC